VDGVLVRNFVYEDKLKPIAEFDGVGNLVAEFIYGSKSNLPDYLVKYGTAAGTYRTISDHLGSPRIVVNVASGIAAQVSTFDEFGVVRHDSMAGFQPFGFAGGIFDVDTELVRFGARDYEPRVGRWVAKDPTQFWSNPANLYSYAINDPINLVDMNGRFVVDPGHEGLRDLSTIYFHVRRIADDAWAEAGRLERDRAIRRDRRDDFAHCLASCEITRAYDPGTAELFGNAREGWGNAKEGQSSGTESEDTASDQEHNRRGRCIGRSATDSKDCSRQCLDLVR
jgi:RHS repeat-associated protein